MSLYDDEEYETPYLGDDYEEDEDCPDFMDGFEGDEFPFEEDENDFDCGMDPQEKLDFFESENPFSELIFDTDDERNQFCNKYSKLMRAAGVDEDTIDEKIEDIQNGTMTREDYCDYYNCSDDELDDVMDSDMRED